MTWFRLGPWKSLSTKGSWSARSRSMVGGRVDRGSRRGVKRVVGLLSGEAGVGAGCRGVWLPLLAKGGVFAGVACLGGRRGVRSVGGGTASARRRRRVREVIRGGARLRK